MREFSSIIFRNRYTVVFCFHVQDDEKKLNISYTRKLYLNSYKIDEGGGLTKDTTLGAFPRSSGYLNVNEIIEIFIFNQFPRRGWADVGGFKIEGKRGRRS